MQQFVHEVSRKDSPEFLTPRTKFENSQRILREQWNNVEFVELSDLYRNLPMIVNHVRRMDVKTKRPGGPGSGGPRCDA